MTQRSLPSSVCFGPTLRVGTDSREFRKPHPFRSRAEHCSVRPGPLWLLTYPTQPPIRTLRERKTILRAKGLPGLSLPYGGVPGRAGG